MKMADVCYNCLCFFKTSYNEHETMGMCRQFPPHPNQKDNDRAYGRFPLVSIRDWCGKYARNKESKNR